MRPPVLKATQPLLPATISPDLLHETPAATVWMQLPPLMTVLHSSPKWRKTSHQLDSSISTRSSSISDTHLTAEEILAAPLPRGPRSRMLSQEAKGSTLHTKKPAKVHPHLRKLSACDPCNGQKRSLFTDQNSSLKLVVAGVPKEGALHPNSCPSLASPPSPCGVVLGEV